MYVDALVPLLPLLFHDDPINPLVAVLDCVNGVIDVLVLFHVPDVLGLLKLNASVLFCVYDDPLFVVNGDCVVVNGDCGVVLNDVCLFSPNGVAVLL